MIPAFSYARVSSREQEREGYSIPAQRKLLAEYARTHGFSIQHEFIDIESAKNPGRKEFTNMLRLLETGGTCHIVLVEKTDRLYRNRADALAVEALIEKRGVEIHLVTTCGSHLVRSSDSEFLSRTRQHSVKARKRAWALKKRRQRNLFLVPVFLV